MKELDILGKRVNFYYKKQETINSGFGGLISSFIVIVLALLIASFGQDFFKRTNPSMVSSVKSPKDYTKFWINNKNFSFAFQLGDFKANQNSTLFYPVIQHYYYSKDENNNWIYTKDHLEIKPCSDDLFYDGNDFIASSAYGVMSCPVFKNYTVGGYADGQFMAKIQIEIFQCMEGDTDLNGIPCESDEKKNKILSDKLYFVMYYQTTLIDANNYDEGLKRTIESNYYTLDTVLYKNPYYFFQNITLETDYGWIMKSKKTESYLAFKTKYMDMNSFATLNSGGYKDSLTRAVIYFSKDTQEYFREYVKVQTLAAQVGGIIKMFMIMGSVLVDRYNLFKAKFELGSLIMYDNQEEIKNSYYQKDIKNNKFISKENPNRHINKDIDLLKNKRNLSNLDILNYSDSNNNSNNRIIDSSKFVRSTVVNNKDQTSNPVNIFASNYSNCHIKEFNNENNLENAQSNNDIDRHDVMKLRTNKDYFSSNKNILNISENRLENNNLQMDVSHII